MIATSLNKLMRILYQARAGRGQCCKPHTYVRGTFATLIVHCAAKEDERKNSFEFPDSSRLSHEHLIQQACTASVNSACQLLTCTLVALVDVKQKYRKALQDQLSLLEESLSNIGNEPLQDELTDLITAARSNITTLKKNFMDLVSLMDYVEKLANSTTETSFLAGAETACAALSERVHSAKIMVEDHVQDIKKLEEELVKLQQIIIVKSRKPDQNHRNQEIKSKEGS